MRPKSQEVESKTGNIEAFKGARVVSDPLTVTVSDENDVPMVTEEAETDDDKMHDDVITISEKRDNEKVTDQNRNDDGDDGKEQNYNVGLCE